MNFLVFVLIRFVCLQLVFLCFSTCRGGDDPCQTCHHQTQWQSSFIFPLWFDWISSSFSWKKESGFDKPSRLEWSELPEECFPFTWYMTGLNPKPETHAWFKFNYWTNAI
jgi:hypothetical protein